MTTLTWGSPPTKPGLYLRTNAGGSTNQHRAVLIDDVLNVTWGNRMQRMDQPNKLAFWQWYGPIPEPPELTAQEGL